MGKQQKLSPKRIVIGLLAIAAIIGAFLGRVTPMEAGFSSLFKKEEEVINRVEDKKEAEIKESTVEIEEIDLSYADQINQEIQQGKFVNRLAVPLLLQTDERWQADTYGTGENNTLKQNGCAILSLAMVNAYLDQTEVVPQTILEWSQDNYFVETQGTSWTIFEDFAAAKGYAYEELMTIDMVEEHLSQGHPVIISVQPGLFTEVGHIMVITGYNEGQFWLNDPNDDKEKKHSITSYTVEQLTADALNYWTIYK